MLKKPIETTPQPEPPKVDASTIIEFSEDLPPKNKGGRPRSFVAPDGYQRITVNLPVKFHNELRLQAALHRVTITELIYRAVGQMLGVTIEPSKTLKRKRRPRKPKPAEQPPQE